MRFESSSNPDRKLENLSAIREMPVSRHHGGLIKGAPKTPRTSCHYGVEGFKAASIILRRVDFSDSRFKFFQSRLEFPTDDIPLFRLLFVVASDT